MRIILTVLALMALATAPVNAETTITENYNGFGDDLTMSEPHPGFGNPMTAEDLNSITPAAGEELNNDGVIDTDVIESEINRPRNIDIRDGGPPANDNLQQ